MNIIKKIKRVKIGFEDTERKIDNILKAITKGSVGLLLFTLIAYGSQNVASNAYSEITLNSGEESLLQKDKVVNDIVVCKEGVNGYQASSKTLCLSDGFSEDRLQILVDKGYSIYITDTQSNMNLPEPVKLDGKVIVVSTHSLDDDLVDTVNKLVS